MRARGIPADPQAAATWFARAAAAGAILLPDACLYLTVPDEARWSRSHARVLATAGHLDRACKLAVAAYDIGHQYESERVQQAVRQFRTRLSPRPCPVTAELDDRLGTAYGRS